MTAELVPLDEHRARQLTDRIRQAADDLWALLLEAHEGRAWAALGYRTWEEYVRAEFNMSRSRSYQLVDQGLVAREVTRVAGVSTSVDITEAEARDLKPHLDLLKQNVHDATVDTDPDAKPGATRAAVEETRRQISKPDLGDGISHPARFSADLLPVFAGFLAPGWKVLDPFAGVGGIHELRDLTRVETVGVEIEPEWAALHDDTIEASALDLPFDDDTFDAIVTSPTYGNRLADHHDASDPESRRSYRHDLGHPLHEENSGQLQWGPKYRDFHRGAWEEAQRVLRHGGRLVLNTKDHVRKGEIQPVTGWHVTILIELGFDLRQLVPVSLTGLRYGANRDARLDHEWILVFDLGVDW